jgi:hypothetical protein
MRYIYPYAVYSSVCKSSAIRVCYSVAHACIRTTSAVDEYPKMAFLCNTSRNLKDLNVFVAFRVSVDLMTYCYVGN